MRSSTYACCFSTVDNSKFRRDYGCQDNSAKIFLTFDLCKLLEQLKILVIYPVRDYKEQINLSFGEVNYLDWKNTQLNVEELQNYVTYLFLKDKGSYSHENEFRLALVPNPLAINTYSVYSSLHLAFNFNQALNDGVIESVVEY